MKTILNEKFLYPIRSRVWSLYSRYSGAKNEARTSRYICHSLYGWLIKSWIPCDGKTQRWSDEECKGPCPAGRMKATVGYRQASECLCDPKDFSSIWVNDDGLRKLAKEGRLRNGRIRRGWSHHHPKIWEELKDQLVD